MNSQNASVRLVIQKPIFGSTSNLICKRHIVVLSVTSGLNNYQSVGIPGRINNKVMLNFDS
jgi:hypothetical protein